MPTLAIACQRFLKELPSKENGLSETEQQTLLVLSKHGDMNAAKLFGLYTNQYERLVYMGDTQYWQVLKGLSAADNPAITIEELDAHHINGIVPPRYRFVSLTKTGHALLHDEVHWLSLNAINRWLGGTRLDSTSGTCWVIGRESDQLERINV